MKPTFENQVGFLVVTKKFKHRQGYETAAWFTDHEVQEGTYAVTRHASGNRAGLHVRFDSVITDQFTGSLYGGVYTGGRSGKEEIGKKVNVCMSDGYYQYGKTLVPFKSYGEFIPCLKEVPNVGIYHERDKHFTVQVITAEDEAILKAAEYYCAE